MKDLIDRRAAIMALVFSDDTGGMTCGQMAKVLDVIKAAPSVQLERKRGRWIEANTHTYGIYECTACKAWTYIPNEPRDYNFCPRCGADMREDDHETD